MIIAQIRECLDNLLRFTTHAKEEMVGEIFGEITEGETIQVLENGKIIEQYPEDRPFPSCLVYGKTRKGRPLHVVCALVAEEKILVIITVYEPDPTLWVDFQRRKK